MISPRTDGQHASFAHAYTALIAAAHIDHQTEVFAPYVVGFRSKDDDAEIAHATAIEIRLNRRVQALQARAANNPDDTRLKCSFEKASENLDGQKSVIETLKQNRSIELEEKASEIKECLLAHNYKNTVRIPHDTIMILDETNGVRHVAFLVRRDQVVRLKDDPCFKDCTLTRIMPPRVA